VKRLLAAIAVLAATAPATAQDRTDAAREDGSVVGSDYAVDPIFVPSPETFTFELRVGSYQPEFGPAFEATIAGDLGPFLGAELDVHIVRIPYVGPIAIGVGFAWGEWTGPARADTTTPTTANVGSTGLSLVDLSALAVLRVDVLARQLDVPLVLSGKIGLDVGYSQAGSGGMTRLEGWSLGLRWAAQVALELDFLEPRAARRLDDEWGINHSEIFFELFGSTMGQWAGDQMPVGTSLAWTAGLGITF
jgi:hypothetical protein